MVATEQSQLYTDILPAGRKVTSNPLYELFVAAVTVTPTFLWTGRGGHLSEDSWSAHACWQLEAKWNHYETNTSRQAGVAVGGNLKSAHQ